MAISVDYPRPIFVNGYLCRNCTDVDLARKHIDPAHAKDGPFGVEAAAETAGGGRGPSAATTGQGYRPGSRVDVAA